MKLLITIGVLLAVCLLHETASSRSSQVGELRIWPSEPPADIPFPPSQDLTGIAFTGRYAHYGNADTWYPTWASNDNLYSPWTDGKVNGVSSGSMGLRATTGYATIVGNDPLHLTITDVGVYPASPCPTRAGIQPGASSITESGSMGPIVCRRHQLAIWMLIFLDLSLDFDIRQTTEALGTNLLIRRSTRYSRNRSNVIYRASIFRKARR